MNREQIAERMQFDFTEEFPLTLDLIEAIVREVAQAERHRIFAAIDADYGAFLRDQGFQEWRAKKQQETTK